MLAVLNLQGWLRRLICGPFFCTHHLVVGYLAKWGLHEHLGSSVMDAIRILGYRNHGCRSYDIRQYNETFGYFQITGTVWVCRKESKTQTKISFLLPSISQQNFMSLERLDLFLQSEAAPQTDQQHCRRITTTKDDMMCSKWPQQWLDQTFGHPCFMYKKRGLQSWLDDEFTPAILHFEGAKCRSFPNIWQNLN